MHAIPGPEPSGNPGGFWKQRKKVEEIDENKMPALGSPKAAVQAAVNLLAKVAGVSEPRLAYWLDMYYQLRCRYEEDRRRADQTGDATPQSPPEEAATAPLAGEPEAGAPEVPDGFAAVPVPETPAAKAEDDSGAEVRLPQDGSREQPKGKSKYTNNGPTRAAQEKRRIRERFLEARKNGLATPDLLRACGGVITETDVWKAVNGHNLGIDSWRLIDAALAKLEQ